MIKLKHILLESLFDTLKRDPDLKILIAAVKNVVNVDVDDMLKSANMSGREGYYLRVPHIRGWTTKQEEDLRLAFDEANQKTKKYTFELYNVEDEETEPGERIWNASFTFFATPARSSEPNDKETIYNALLKQAKTDVEVEETLISLLLTAVQDGDPDDIDNRNLLDKQYNQLPADIRAKLDFNELDNEEGLMPGEPDQYKDLTKGYGQF